MQHCVLSDEECYGTNDLTACRKHGDEWGNKLVDHYTDLECFEIDLVALNA